MAIGGPKIQVPSAFSKIAAEDGAVNQEWASLFHSLQQTAFALSRNGPTTSRPTSSLDGRWIGMPYFDTTLGFTVYLKSVNPDIWVDGQGNTV